MFRLRVAGTVFVAIARACARTRVQALSMCLRKARNIGGSDRGMLGKKSSCDRRLPVGCPHIGRPIPRTGPVRITCIRTACLPGRPPATATPEHPRRNAIDSSQRNPRVHGLHETFPAYPFNPARAAPPNRCPFPIAPVHPYVFVTIWATILVPQNQNPYATASKSQPHTIEMVINRLSTSRRRGSHDSNLAMIG